MGRNRYRYGLSADRLKVLRQTTSASDSGEVGISFLVALLSHADE
jgi:hypothetical protein